MKLIVATNLQGYLGKDSKMMWRSSEDFKHFKQMTMGGILIVGRVTFEQCLGSRHLPGRTTIVVGHGNNEYCPSILQALKVALNFQETRGQEIWVIGGAKIYNALVHLCDHIHISIIDNNDIGDCKFEIPSDYMGQITQYKFNADK